MQMTFHLDKLAAYGNSLLEQPGKLISLNVRSLDGGYTSVEMDSQNWQTYLATWEAVRGQALDVSLARLSYHLALIIVGSVARDDAGDGSDVDFFVVVADQAYEALTTKDATCIEAHACCVPPCPEANGYFTSKAALRQIATQGNDISRYTYTRAQIVFSRDPEIDCLVADIPRYPEADRLRRYAGVSRSPHHRSGQSPDRVGQPSQSLSPPAGGDEGAHC